MLESTFAILGYRPEDDSWDTDGRRTYLHEDDVTKAWLLVLRRILARQGWERHPNKLRAFCHSSGQIIEIEPSGYDCTGHYLHHMKTEVASAV